MTIKELEKRTGLDRATIRFYEKEDLIAPKRLANGYRDYSEEDALALEKIALLRRLDLPLEDIRRAQNGEVPLGLALEKNEEALVVRQKEIGQALHISRAIPISTRHSFRRPDRRPCRRNPNIMLPAIPGGVFSPGSWTAFCSPCPGWQRWSWSASCRPGWCFS